MLNTWTTKDFTYLNYFLLFLSFCDMSKCLLLAEYCK